VHYELYVGRSPLDPAHETEEERFAIALAEVWRKSVREAVSAGARPAPPPDDTPHFA
jgi:hypothetical protein